MKTNPYEPPQSIEAEPAPPAKKDSHPLVDLLFVGLGLSTLLFLIFR